MPEFSKECDKDQGFDFKQEEHKTFGYINTLVIGEVEIAPDIKVPEPSAGSGVTIKASGAGAGSVMTLARPAFSKACGRRTEKSRVEHQADRHHQVRRSSVDLEHAGDLDAHHDEPVQDHRPLFVCDLRV
ncbi:MAG: hypothetical protein U0787_18830 [Polyangia bacterium]